LSTHQLFILSLDMLSDQTCSELHTQLLFTTGLVLQENV